MLLQPLQARLCVLIKFIRGVVGATVHIPWHRFRPREGGRGRGGYIYISLFS